MHFLAHPIKSLKNPKKWLKGAEGDNYYNKDAKGVSGDIAYLGTSIATSLVNKL
jgi:hypothetical protein